MCIRDSFERACDINGFVLLPVKDVIKKCFFMFHICFQFSHTFAAAVFAPKTVITFSIFTNFKFKAHVRFNSTVHSHDFLPLAATSQGVITFSGLCF